MERWSLEKYARPYLAASSIRALGDQLSLQGEAETFIIDGCADAAVGDQLDRLRDPAAPLWQALQQDRGKHRDLETVLAHLDDAALIQDAALPTSSSQRFDAILAQARHSLAPGRTKAVTQRRLDAIAKHVEPAVRSLLADHPGVLLTVEALPSAPSSVILTEPDFAMVCVILQIDGWRRWAPLSLLAVGELISEDLDPVLIEPLFDLSRELLATDMYDLVDLSAHLDGFVTLLTYGNGEETPRLLRAPDRATTDTSGLNHALETERSVAGALGTLGPSNFAATFDQNEALRPPLIRMAFEQEYHLTRRFVEVITPSLHKRFSNPLRQRFYKYYREEEGHEAFEAKTCAALGIGQSTLDERRALPLHLAFIECLTWLSETDPISFFSCLITTEGLPGDPFGINDLAEDSISDPEFLTSFRQHEAVNEDCNHAYLTRLMLAHVSRVSPHQGQRAIAYALFLTELNYRAWNDLARRVGATQPLPDRSLQHGTAD